MALGDASCLSGPSFATNGLESALTNRHDFSNVTLGTWNGGPDVLWCDAVALVGLRGVVKQQIRSFSPRKDFISCNWQ